MQGSLGSIPLHGAETAHGIRKTTGEFALELHNLTTEVKLKDFENERRGQFTSKSHLWEFLLS